MMNHSLYWNYKYLILAFGILLFVGCKKDSDDAAPPTNNTSTTISFKINYEIDGQPLIFDSLLYYNDAGNHYQVSSLLYFLTEIELVRQDSSIIRIKDYQYIDASILSTGQFSISDPPAGNYIGLRFNIGVDSIHNIPGGLPANTDNNNMEWPVTMGGGYHHMKFEGYFVDGGSPFGFAMHLGMNACLVPVRLYQPISITSTSSSLNLTMNLNEWFRNPSVYDFNVDGNYTMGVMPLMMKLSANGKDVFHL